MLRKPLNRKWVGGIRCASARASGFNFQACSFNHSDISPREWSQQFSGAQRPASTRIVPILWQRCLDQQTKLLTEVSMSSFRQRHQLAELRLAKSERKP